MIEFEKNELKNYSVYLERIKYEPELLERFNEATQIINDKYGIKVGIQYIGKELATNFSSDGSKEYPNIQDSEFSDWLDNNLNITLEQRKNLENIRSFSKILLELSRITFNNQNIQSAQIISEWNVSNGWTYYFLKASEDNELREMKTKITKNIPETNQSQQKNLKITNIFRRII